MPKRTIHRNTRRISRCRLWGPAVVACACLLGVAPLLAQPVPAASAQDGSADPPALDLEVTVYGRVLATEPQSVTVIDRNAIEASGSATVDEVLHRAASVHVLGGGSRGSLTAQLRGGDPNFTVVLIDGVPLNDATDQLGGAVNLAGLSTVGLERIEIVRGPMSFFHGSAPLAGVINLVTRREESGRATVRAEVEAGGTSMVRGGVSAGGGAEWGDYAVSSDWAQERGRIGDDRFDRVDVTGRLRRAVGDTAEFSVVGRAASWAADDYLEGSGGPRLGSGERRSTESDEVSLRAELQAGRGGRARRAGALVTHRRARRDSPAIVSAVPPGVEATRYTRIRAGGAVDLHTRRSVRLVGGLDVDDETGDNESLLELPPAFGGPVAGSYALHRTTAGAYAEALLGSGDLLVQVGGRVDVPTGERAQWSPRAGASYRPGGGSTRLRGVFGRAFKLPSFFALGSPPALGGNPDLRSETSWGATSAWSSGWAPGWSSPGRSSITASRIWWTSTSRRFDT